jgi:hypothetical protein|uniref:Uncharacterized protein n=1 Tax=viral metagenome TaxID=1070528 RepID=A0A6C0CCI9_9ZZZZ
MRKTRRKKNYLGKSKRRGRGIGCSKPARKSKSHSKSKSAKSRRSKTPETGARHIDIYEDKIIAAKTEHKRLIEQLDKQDLTDKEKYKLHLDNALELNNTLHELQRAEMLRLEKLGLDGPARGTRSQTHSPDSTVVRHPYLANVIKDKKYTETAIKWNKAALKRFNDGKDEDYKELLRNKAGWDNERMAPDMLAA